MFGAAREPKELRWRPGTHHQWGAGIYRDVFGFLERELEPARRIAADERDPNAR